METRTNEGRTIRARDCKTSTREGEGKQNDRRPLGLDDDGDGATDCDDADCSGDPACDCLPKNATCNAEEECCSGICKNNGRCR